MAIKFKQTKWGCYCRFWYRYLVVSFHKIQWGEYGFSLQVVTEVMSMWYWVPVRESHCVQSSVVSAWSKSCQISEPCGEDWTIPMRTVEYSGLQHVLKFLLSNLKLVLGKVLQFGVHWGTICRNIVHYIMARFARWSGFQNFRKLTQYLLIFFTRVSENCPDARSFTVFQTAVHLQCC